MLKKIALLLLLTPLSIGLFAQSNDNFKFTPEKAYNGKPLTIYYNPAGTSLSGKKDVRAVVYQYINYKWNAVDLKFKAENKQWKADFNIPADCGLLGFKFIAGDSVDNNKNLGYFILMNDKDRESVMAPGAYIGWGYARSPQYGKDIPGYINFKGISDTATYHWLNQEISFNQKSKSLLALDYAKALKAYMGESAKPKLDLAGKYLSRPDASENDLLNARYIYQHLTGEKELTDSLNDVLKKRFPNGSLARLAAYRKISTYRDLDSVIIVYAKFLQDFPEYKTNVQFDAANRIIYGVVYQNLMVYGAMKNSKTDYVAQYTDSISYNFLPTIYYKLIGIAYHRKEGDLNKLAAYSDLLVKRFEYFKQNRPESMSYLSPMEWAKEYRRVFVSNVSAVHIGLLNHKGNYQTALKYAEEAERELKYSNAEINNEYAIALKKLNKSEELEQVLVKSMFNNQSSTEMIAMLKDIYVKKHKSEKGYDAYFESLKNPANQKHNAEEVKASMIKKEMPAWSMKDLNGKTVNSADLKGKTVILDFWATWCVPCKASFPGMKLAVEKYRNDPNVVFYFVDTEERGETYKAENAKYIKDNNYPFNVLFDNKVAGEKTNSEVFNKICKAFTISGIPQKLIIDKNGFLRFISIGFNGSATSLADEMSNLIELTKTAD
ncbi:redoxin domain-containing protein [Pedobacter petrophilus]|uniref:Redoxin domain-containing protein n=1 Tax=Pedobacter petrophilus TaxID=1908241 RepID=A0A7K0G351_9SPHI|nr:TlpA disulfide reductase family protein [Pedobacter petrophilus]MRX78121.1 redoxin domain-containing protein [Pedobacter petrophilus]